MLAKGFDLLTIVIQRIVAEVHLELCDLMNGGKLLAAVAIAPDANFVAAGVASLFEGRGYHRGLAVTLCLEGLPIDL
jgi:hypothetical protein